MSGVVRAFRPSQVHTASTSTLAKQPGKAGIALDQTHVCQPGASITASSSR